MSRMNNTSRSLQIVSLQNGWDPTQIIEPANDYAEDRVQVGDSRSIPSSINNVNNERELDLQPPTPDPGHVPSTARKNSDPTPSMPGA